MDSNKVVKRSVKRLVGLAWAPSVGTASAGIPSAGTPSVYLRRAVVVPSVVLGALWLGGCEPEGVVGGADAAVGSISSDDSSDEHAGHQSSGNSTGTGHSGHASLELTHATGHSTSGAHSSTGHDGTGHDGTGHDTGSSHTQPHGDAGHTETGHTETGHGNTDAGHGDTSHDTPHEGVDAGAHDTDSHDTDSHDTTAHTSAHTGTSGHTQTTDVDHTDTHNDDHTDTTGHDASSHDTHVDDSDTDDGGTDDSDTDDGDTDDSTDGTDTTHAHTDDSDDGPDASVSDDGDATDTSDTTEETHDHTDIDVSDETRDASLDEDAGADAGGHDHETTDSSADSGDTDSGPNTDTSATTSTDHHHTSGPTDSTSTSGTTGNNTSTGNTTSDTTSDHTDHEQDHCIVGYAPDPSDALMDDGYDVYIETRNGQQYPDATVQTQVIEWMERNYWQEAHFQWHQARRCPRQPTSDPNDIEICQYPEFVKQDNECENNANGVEFLAMHRHMIKALKELFPNHTEQFEGWDNFPGRNDYPELLRDYFVNWSNGVLQAANIADNIEDYTFMFADEGAFGRWIQCGGFFNGTFSANLHGALHFNGYSPDNQSHSVANQRRNLDAYLFWKLHGYIDKIWERYRVAKGLAPDDPNHVADVVEQCQEMHRLSELVESIWNPVDPDPDPDPDPTEIKESGYFHEVVRPFLEEARCRGCHGENTPAAGLQLGFLTSTEIVEQLVGQASRNAVGQTLVVPGNPEQSWLYRKISGLSVTDNAVTCQASAPECHQAMPQGNGPMSTEAQAAIYEWIADGALAPTIED